MATAVGTGRGTFTSPCVTSSSAQNPTDPLQSERPKGLSVFTRKQQRTVKLFLLRASRPLLKQSKSASRQTAPALVLSHPMSPGVDSQTAPAGMEAPVGSDPLPLHALQAFEEARRAKQYENMAGTPLDSAISAVDWMLDLAQGVSRKRHDWPVLGWLKEETGGSVQPPEAFLDMPIKGFLEGPEGDVVGEDYAEGDDDVPAPSAFEADEQALEMMYPRCKWPRTTSAMSTPAPLPSTSGSLLYGSLTSNHPRCSWPRETGSSTLRQTSVPSMGSSVLGEPFGSELTSTSPEDTSLSSAYPRCSWPRNTQKSATSTSAAEPASIPASEPELGSPSQEDIDSLERIFAAEPNVGVPHCAWPRQGGIPGKTLDSENPIGAHCSWPKKGALKVFERSSEAETILGPRCAWPRRHSAISRAASSAVAVPTAEAEGGLALAALSARCSWPRVARVAADAASLRGELPSLGPRCAFPRAANQEMTAGPLVVVQQFKAVEGARCAWPKTGGLNGNSAEARTETSPGPRCAWPRTGGSVGSF